jgi:hypothetical protein
MIEPLYATGSGDASERRFQGFSEVKENGFVAAANGFVARVR